MFSTLFCIFSRYPFDTRKLAGSPFPFPPFPTSFLCCVQFHRSGELFSLSSPSFCLAVHSKKKPLLSSLLFRLISLQRRAFSPLPLCYFQQMFQVSLFVFFFLKPRLPFFLKDIAVPASFRSPPFLTSDGQIQFPSLFFP